MELITFDKGLNKKSSPLVLEDGEMVTLSGFAYDSTGDLGARKAKEAVSTTAVGTIHTIHRYKNYLLLGDGKTLRYKWVLDGYCDRYTPANYNFTSCGTLSNSNRLRIADAEDFIFFVNGQDAKAFSSGNVYEWNIPAPTQIPKGTAATGSLSDTYYLYYTYFVKFPNGRTYETAPSPAGSVTVSSQGINWSNIGCSNYSGTGVTIYRKLYRSSDSLIELYYVATIRDNTTTVYETDAFSDATLEANSTITTEGMSPVPDGFVDIEYYLSRVFGIKECYLYPSEAYLPFTFDLDNSIQVSPQGIDLVSVVSWGDQLYLATSEKWYRLQGTTAATWVIRGTFAETGTINRNTVIATRFGIIAQWFDGLYVFDGSTSRSLTRNNIPTSVFTGMTYPKNSYASFDGNLYKFYYPSTGSTIDSCLVMDMREYPNVKFYNEDFIATASEYHFSTGIQYYGYGGKHYKDGTTETFSTSLQTSDRVDKHLPRQSELEYLYYDINTNSQNVIVTFYVDGTAQTPTITLNTSSRTRGRKVLPKWQGYRFSMKLDCADSSGLHIYGPWFVSTNPYGD